MHRSWESIHAPTVEARVVIFFFRLAHVDHVTGPIVPTSRTRRAEGVFSRLDRKGIRPVIFFSSSFLLSSREKREGAKPVPQSRRTTTWGRFARGSAQSNIFTLFGRAFLSFPSSRRADSHATLGQRKTAKLGCSFAASVPKRPTAAENARWRIGMFTIRPASRSKSSIGSRKSASERRLKARPKWRKCAR